MSNTQEKIKRAFPEPDLEDGEQRAIDWNDPTLKPTPNEQQLLNDLIKLKALAERLQEENRRIKEELTKLQTSKPAK